MDNCRNSTVNTLGFCLLPSELIQEILLRLALPEILCLKTVCKTLTSIISGDEFRREFSLRSSSDTWLFVYKKRSPRHSVVLGFTDRSNRWFKIPIPEFLIPVVPPGEDLYFLTASGVFFLFASNNRRELIAANLMKSSVRKIPPNPLGPRGTSSWRRSGLKLIAGPPGSDHFRFLFAELIENRPVLFEYSSETDTWRSQEAREESDTCMSKKHCQMVFLSVIHRRSESVMIGTGPENDLPVVLRPRFDGGGIEERLAIGFSTGDVSDRLHVYGDGNMVIVRSEGVDGNGRLRLLRCIEVWAMSIDGRFWEFVSKVPNEIVGKVKKPYAVMMGCLEEREGIIRVVLVSNFEGSWDLIWLSYHLGRKVWTWVQLPKFKMKGLNMAGITLSSGISLS